MTQDHREAERAAEKFTKGMPAFMRSDMKRAFIAGWFGCIENARAALGEAQAEEIPF